MECLTCQSIAGERRISPGPFIYEGTHWLVDHGYPTALKGWLVIVTRRHVEALHELSKEAFAELAEIQYRLSRVVSQDAHVQKEYMMCFAEAELFAHVHIHFIARPYDLPAEARGPRVFMVLNVEDEQAIPAEEIVQYSEKLRERYLTVK